MEYGRPEKIGIWKRAIKNGKAIYSRDVARQAEWPLWADVHEIPARSAKKRIVLLGESVARGYFYDPYYTVAGELAAILNKAGELGPAEVIDLARTGMPMDDLLENAVASRGLEPDAVVIFAGNNWASRLGDSLEEEDYREMYAIYGRDQFPGVKSYLERKFQELIFGLLRGIEKGLISKGIPVVFVIPPYNLSGWKSDEVERMLSWLPEGRRAVWLAAMERGKAAYKEKKIGELESAGKIMVDADPSDPLGFEWLGECHMVHRRWEQAVECFELARDTTLLGRGNNSKPRCFKVIRETLLAAAGQYNIRLVDPHCLFRDLSSGGMPDPGFFLDYCHLSIAGIKAAMRYTARAVIMAIDGRELPIESIAESGLRPGVHVQGTAHFCAAVHSAHHGQPFEIVHHHCERAVSFFPGIRETMLKYMDFSTRHASSLFCKSYEEVITEERMRQSEGGLALPHPKDGKLMDLILVDSMVQALSAVGNGTQEEIVRLRIQEHGVCREELDLMESFYRKTCYNEFNTIPQPGFLQARSTETRFFFIAEAGQPVSVRLIYRTPGARVGTGAVHVFLNDPAVSLAALSSTDRWQAACFTIPANRIKRGTNELLFTWPYTGQESKTETDISANSFLRAVFPVIGEISEIYVRVVDPRPSEALKADATELADLVCRGQQGGRHAEVLFARLSAGRKSGEGAETGGGDPAVKDPDHVGIWAAHDKNGQTFYRRDANKKAEWHLWADVHEIPPKSSRRRVILLGESVARGFLYDPYFNVAKELQAVLSGTRDLRDVEVVDLSRVSLLLAPLSELVGACLKCRPDAVVLFAGNNWVYSLNELPYDQQELLRVFETEGSAGIKSLRECQMKEIVGAFFCLLKETLLKAGLPVVFVIPEFNLKDWKSHAAEQILPRASGERVAKWLEACRKAERASRENHPEDMASAAASMVEADGSNPYGYELLADHYLNSRLWEQARESLETARDTILFNRSNNSMPRCIRIIRESIVSEAQRLEIGVVDLPAIFRELFADGLPDRSLFLDNCHLTVKGIKIAARYTVRALAEAMGKRPVPIDEIRAPGVVPDDHVQAVAHFCAAIYNSHYGQGGEIIGFHCRQALSLSPSIREAMLRYADLSTRYAPSILCRSFGELLTTGEMQQYEGGYALRHPRGKKLMDIRLTDAIAGVVERFESGVTERLAALRMEEHGIKEPKDLLESYYRMDSYHEFFASSDKAFVQVRALHSDFQFIADGSGSLGLTIVYRTPNVDPAGKAISIRMNDHGDAIDELPVNKKWRECTFFIDRRHIRKGVNKLIIDWPYITGPAPGGSTEPFMEAVFPVMAEVYCLQVSNRERGTI